MKEGIVKMRTGFIKLGYCFTFCLILFGAGGDNLKTWAVTVMMPQESGVLLNNKLGLSAERSANVIETTITDSLVMVRAIGLTNSGSKWGVRV